MSCELGRVGNSSEGCCLAADESEKFDWVEISLTDSKRVPLESPALDVELAENLCAIGLPIKTARRMRCLIPPSYRRVEESSSSQATVESSKKFCGDA